MKSMLSLVKIHPLFIKRRNKFFFKPKDIKQMF